MARVARLALLALFVAVAACAKPTPTSEQRATAEPANDIAPVAPPPSRVEAATNPAIRPKLAVDGEGLRLIDPASGRATPLAFGRPEEEVVATLERLRGKATRGTNGECGAGPLQIANWPDGLSLLFQDKRFAGWSLDARAAGAITTMAGIGPGSSRSDLEAAYAAKFTQTTIGTEFSAGALGGLLDGTKSGAKITTMWAGITCIFR